MQFLEDFKHKIGKWVFQRDLRTNKRLKEVSNLEKAKHEAYEAFVKDEIDNMIDSIYTRIINAIGDVEKYYQPMERRVGAKFKGISVDGMVKRKIQSNRLKKRVDIRSFLKNHKSGGRKIRNLL